MLTHLLVILLAQRLKVLTRPTRNLNINIGSSEKFQPDRNKPKWNWLRGPSPLVLTIINFRILDIYRGDSFHPQICSTMKKNLWEMIETVAVRLYWHHQTVSLHTWCWRLGMPLLLCPVLAQFPLILLLTFPVTSIHIVVLYFLSAEKS